MRAGAFADRRVIELLNRRFIPFFFNTSGPGEGKDPAAKAFVAKKGGNQWAYFAGFNADGTYLGEPEIYADERDTHRFLLDLIAEQPEFCGPGAEEQKLMARLAAKTAGFDDLIAIVEIGEALDRDRLSRRALDEALSKAKTDEQRRRALVCSARISRRTQDWTEHDAALAALETLADGHGTIDTAAERGRRALIEDRNDEALTILEAAIRSEPAHPRHDELRCYAGKACFRLGRLDRAKFHWMWVVENLPESPLYMRCKIAAAADAMPYPNSLLDGYKAKVGMIGPHSIVSAVNTARRGYRHYAARFANPEADLDAEDEESREKSGLAGKVDSLRDGEQHVIRNNEILPEIIGAGEAAIPELMRAMKDQGHAGRAWAAWGLAKLLATLERQPAEALEALDAAAKDEDAYVRLLAKSGRNRLSQGTLNKGSVGGDEAKLVRRLRDGNPFVSANNPIVDQLQTRGQAAVDALADAIRDPEFEGRGYAAWALALVIVSSGSKDEGALALLESCAEEDDDSYVRLLANSGHGVLKASRAPGKRGEPSIAELESALMIVARLAEAPFEDRHCAAISARLVAFGEDAIPALSAALADTNFSGRAAAAMILGELCSTFPAPPQSVLDLLSKVAVEKPSMTSAAAASVLDWLGGDDTDTEH